MTRGDNGSRAAAWAVTGLTFLFLFAPLAVVVLMSFNTSPFGTLPFHFTWHWYGDLWQQTSLWQATWLSVGLSGGVSVVAVIIALPLAFQMARSRARWVQWLTGVMVATITIPWLILGLAMLLMLNALLVEGRTNWGLFLGDLAVVMPYVTMVVVARIQDLPPSLEEAARSLGARGWQTFWYVSGPLIFPAVLSGGLMAFIVCFNNFVIQYLLAPFGVSTLPMTIYSLVRVGYQPDINALASILLAGGLAIVWGLTRLGGVARASGASGSDATRS
jgi:ABC-type spermidine/putrescine transport system permease subunit II